MQANGLCGAPPLRTRSQKLARLCHHTAACSIKQIKFQNKMQCNYNLRIFNCLYRKVLRTILHKRFFKTLQCTDTKKTQRNKSNIMIQATTHPRALDTNLWERISLHKTYTKKTECIQGTCSSAFLVVLFILQKHHTERADATNVQS